MASYGDQVNENEIKNRNENETATALQTNAIDASNDHQIDEKQSTVNSNVSSNKKKRKCTNQTSLNVVNEIDSNIKCVTNDASNIEYRVVQNENKRKKIEISKQQKRPESVNVAFENATLSKNNLETGCSINTNKIPTEKPPLPPKPKNIKKMSIQTDDCCKCSSSSKLKTKYESIQATTVQKLLAQSEQLRLEIGQLKAALASEQNVVRVLRAQNDANLRKEKFDSLKRPNKTIKAKDETSQVPPPPLPSPSPIPEKQQLIDKLLKEIEVLKETNKNLAEKAQKSTKADRQKITDIRQIKESYEHRLTQLTKSSNIEIHRLFDEIKTKDKTIGSLKKDVAALKAIQKNKTTTKNDKTSQQKMRKKEIELCDNGTMTTTIANSTNTTVTNNTTQTTCRHDIFTMPHEIRERIINVQNDLQFCKSKDLSGSDNDSALSSAPPSLSPQPGTQSNSPDVWQALLKESKDHENLQKEYDLIKEENQFLNCEITLAEEQIRELEKVLRMTRENNRTNELLERINQLECKEAAILKEAHELREQNELLEFRILELEEGSEKIVNSKPIAVRDAQTSPTSFSQQNHYNESQNYIYDSQSLEQMPSDFIRRKLLQMSKHDCFDEREKICLFQVHSLLNSLEALSQDQEISFDDESIKSIAEKMNRFCAVDSNGPRSGSFSFSSSTPINRSPERVVATVQPYSTKKSPDDSLSISCKSSPSKSVNSLSTMSLTESGVFESETIEFINHQSTQTFTEDFPATEKSLLGSDLCAEIQKLNKFRKKIEECVTKCHRSTTNVTSPKENGTDVLSPIEQTRLQYYKDRLEQLESKLSIYESSGDVQTKRLAARLQKEIQLEATVKQLKQRISKLEKENCQLDEERCELEEIENDTRLHLQRLEVDLEILSQRNVELEMSRDTARANADYLQDEVSKAQERLVSLEKDRNEIQNTLDLIKSFMPAILLYNTLQNQESSVTDVTMMDCDTSAKPKGIGICVCNNEHVCPDLNKFAELVQREQELTDNIAELNRAYNETLERADNLWAQMEKDYKDKLARTQEDNSLLRSKISQLEKRLKSDAHYAQERISQLEDEENMLKRRLSKLNKTSKDEADKYKLLQNDYQHLNSEYEKLKGHMEGPLTENLEKERKKTKVLEEEVSLAGKMYDETEQRHKNQLMLVKVRLEKSNKELKSAEVSNAELREEVMSLEHRIMELTRCRKEDEDKIRSLMAENKSKEERPIKPVRIKHNIRNLAQELDGSLNRSTNLNYTQVYALNSVAAKVSDNQSKTFNVNREPMRHQFD